MPERYLKPAYKIFEATVPAEYAALSAANKEAYGLILSCGTVNLGEDSATVDLLAGMFGPGTTTRANIQELMKPEPEPED